jgi:transcriptional regulator with XRE-family HTH domain
VARRNVAMIGEFLTARRRQLMRAELGLPPVGGRRTFGLRREEVAYLAGVSVTWYTWLEQGRDITPSRQVLDALARTLRLSAPEHAYVLSLAGYSAPHPAADSVPQTGPAHVQRLLDALGGYPAYAIAPDWGISAWNSAYAALYPTVTTVAAADRNLLWLLFTDPYLRILMPDWEFTSDYNLASFRAEAGSRLGDPPFSHVVRRLLETSEAFRVAWESHDIETLTSRERLFCHPVVGDLHMEQHSLALSDHPDLRLVVFTPVLTTDTPARLHQLTGYQASPTPPRRGDSLPPLINTSSNDRRSHTRHREDRGG